MAINTSTRNNVPPFPAPIFEKLLTFATGQFIFNVDYYAFYGRDSRHLQSGSWGICTCSSFHQMLTQIVSQPQIPINVVVLSEDDVSNPSDLFSVFCLTIFTPTAICLPPRKYCPAATTSHFFLAFSGFSFFFFFFKGPLFHPLNLFLHSHSFSPKY